MTYEQMFQAMKALAGNDAALHMRHVGDWYVRLPRVEMGGNGLLRSVGASGRTPEEAIEKTWIQLAIPKDGEHVVVNAMGPNRRAFIWNGFMWEDVTEESSRIPVAAE